MSRKKGVEPAKPSTPSPAMAHRAGGVAGASPGPGLNLRMIGLARVAFGLATLVAAYLSYASFTGGGVAGCGPEGGCSEVLSSRWSKWLGIPVSLPAAGLYLALVALSLRLTNRAASGSVRRERWCETALRAGAWTVIGAAVWFLAISAGVIGKFCPYCLVVHLTGSVGAVLLLKGMAAGESTPSTPGRATGTTWLDAAKWAVVPLGILVAGQLLYVPATYRESSTPSPTVATAPGGATPVSPVSSTQPKAGNAAVTPTTAVAPVITAPKSASLSLHGGRFRFDASQVPIMGSTSAPYLMVSQFDYSCDHCRRTHGPIREVQSYFSNELAVICLPMPLDGKCNEWVKRTSSHHANACQYGALALGVYRAAPAKFREFDDYLMHDREPPSVKVAFEHAQQLVGAKALETAVTDAWVPETLQLSISLYRTNWMASRNGAMPMMNVGTNIINGTVSTPADMFRILERGLGLKRRP